MSADCPTIATDSITSGYSVPCARKSTCPSFAASASNTSMNVAPMIFRFVSGSTTPASRSRNSDDASTNTSGSCSRSIALADLRRFVEPQHAVVHEDARQLVADRAMNDERGDRRIDAAAERADDAPVARPARGSSPSPPRQTTPSSSRRCSRRRRTRSSAGCRGRVRCAPPRDETAARTGRDRRPPSPPPARSRSSRRPRILRARRPRNRRGSPRRESRRDVGKQRGGSRQVPAAGPALRRRRRTRRSSDRDRGVAELALRRGRDAPAERVRHQLHAVADAEHRAAHVEQRRIAAGRARIGHALRSTRQDDAGRRARPNLVRRRVRRPDLGIHRQLAKAPGDQLCVLRSEIQNDDRLMAHEGPAWDHELLRSINAIITVWAEAPDHKML